MNYLESYLRKLREIRSSGAAVPETSYYGTLEHLFNEIGKEVKPKVRSIIHIQNQGGGIPDGGFYTSDQFQRGVEVKPRLGTLPSRGVVEVKSFGEDVWRTIKSSQVSKQYLPKYHQVLVTNYRDFVLVVQDANGAPIELESYRLAPNEDAFWTMNLLEITKEHEKQFSEYLKRVMLHAAPLTAPQDLAWFLASYAHTAKDRIEKVDLPSLREVREAIEEILGLKFEGEKGNHFFRSTLVQTIFYGIFSAWVLWNKQNPLTTSNVLFDWRTSVWLLKVPVIRAIFERVVTPSKLDLLNLEEVLDWTSNVLNRVDRAVFFTKFEEGHAVQYFYEPFLQAFDPDLRKELGIWYTPPEIVQYMVKRVDTVLREELQIEDGLADHRVYVLDPCCGTGAYLVEVLKHISANLQDKGEDALSIYDVKQAAMDRVFGFEILPAPVVIAHLQLGLLLQNLGIPLSHRNNERASVYLTNALTGWELPDPEKEKFIQHRLEGMPELKEERDAAQKVKRDVPILVVIGNPPYNAFDSVKLKSKEEQELVEAYKVGLISVWGIKKFNLDDLYVRFFRLAERRITERTGKGVVCYISNFSYLGDPSFVVMRQRFLNEFDKMWFDCLNGDSRGTGKLTPEGKPDPSVFSTEYNREGIRVGTAVALMVRTQERINLPIVRFRHLWGSTKKEGLIQSLEAKDFNLQYKVATPNRVNQFSFRPLEGSAIYLTWPTIEDLCLQRPFRALDESRRGSLMSMDKKLLEQRMQQYYNKSIDWETLKALKFPLTKDGARFDARKTRARVLSTELYNSNNLCRYTLRPFETRWCYYSTVRPLWNEPRPELWAQYWSGNKFLVTRLKTEKEAKGSPFYFSSCLVDYQSLARNVSVVPFHLRVDNIENKGTPQMQLFSKEAEPFIETQANLSNAAYVYLTALGFDSLYEDPHVAELIWLHALAVGYSPNYLTENAEEIRRNWPRIPLPNRKDLLLNSVELGRRVAAILDTESTLPGVTSGKIRSEIRHIGTISRVGGGNLDLDKDLVVTVGWGHMGMGGITMPGRGKVKERDYSLQELDAIKDSINNFDLNMDQFMSHLGKTTYDIYLNEVAYWKNVPFKVWNYHIGGYQVIKKWLSYREKELIGRSLTLEEIREMTTIARRITALLLLEPALDANYQVIKNLPYMWTSLEI